MTPCFSRKYLVVVILLFFVSLMPTLAFSDAESIFKENSKAVVVIFTYDAQGDALSQGSGFIVRSDGAIVTNYHVISNAKHIQVKVGDSILDVEGLIYSDEENDLVILKVKGDNLPIVKLGDIRNTSVGELIYVISSPQGLENTISNGILSGIRDLTPDTKVLQITAPISSGSSGSPVFNKKGEAIGITTFLLNESQSLNFAMPINLITDKINSNKTIALKDVVIKDYAATTEGWFIVGNYFYGTGVIWEDLGMHKEAFEDYEDAINYYQKVIKINSNHAKAYYNLGLAYFKLTRFQEAINAFNQAIRIEPVHKEAHFKLGMAYLRLDKFHEASDAFNQAIRIEPDHKEAHFRLGVAYGNLDKFHEASDAYKQAIRIDPDYSLAHSMLGFAYLKLGDKGSALDEYKILKDLNKEWANALFDMIYK